MTKNKPDSLSDDEEARIQRLIASDADAPEMTDEQLAVAKPFADAFPSLAENMRQKSRGRPRLQNPKVAVSLRLDADVVAKFKATGIGWQSRMNAVLRREVAVGDLD